VENWSIATTPSCFTTVVTVPLPTKWETEWDLEPVWTWLPREKILSLLLLGIWI